MTLLLKAIKKTGYREQIAARRRQINYQHVFVLFNLLFICFSAQSMVVYGHRGARGLAPENTLPGFQVALSHHVDAIDLDIAMTKDGVLVVYHDLVLNPDITRDATGDWVSIEPEVIVKNLTLKQLQTYDVGRIRPLSIYAAIYASQIPEDHTAIPTLQAVIQDIKKSEQYPVGFQIEIKTDPTRPDLSVSADEIVSALNQVLEAEGISDRTKVQAYDWQCLLMLQQLNSKIETAYLTDIDHEKVLRNMDAKIAGSWTIGYLLKNYHDSIPEMISALGGTWWDVEDIELTHEALQQAHQLGLKVATWTFPDRTGNEINIPLVIQLIAMGVDGVITDRPDIVRNLLLLSRDKDQKSNKYN
ncbi:MAG: glycerophosphodiester phosphodiesterase family protein [Legionella sp.]|nr:glycerophosphodiester phosphodiesterase family protein [Legionella sp.]